MTEMPADIEDEDGFELWPLIDSYCVNVNHELTARMDARRMRELFRFPCSQMAR